MFRWAFAHYSGRMTTSSPEGQRFAPSESHHARQIAESFGSEAERYERTRPTYPQAMVEAIRAASPGSDVLDVGIGTGISARPFHQQGCEVLGVEPDTRMAAFARGSGLQVEIAKFEEWDPAGRTFDLVIAGQTWHWVDPVLGAYKAAEVLRPGGRIALFWNVMSFPPDFAEGSSAIYKRVLPESPFFRAERPAASRPTRRCSTRRLTASERPGSSPGLSSGSSTGNGRTRQTSGSTPSLPSAGTARYRRRSSEHCSQGSEMSSTQQAAASRWATPQS